MYLFEINKRKHARKLNSTREKLFRKLLAKLLKDYLQGEFDYLVYITKLYQAHKRFNRAGFSTAKFEAEKLRYYSLHAKKRC